MSIEFRCSQCNQVLQVGDEEAGKMIKCADCGTEQVPQAPAACSEPGWPPASPREGARAAPDPAEAAGPVAPSNNPYASPQSEPQPADKDDPNAGPPWERDRPSLGSLFATGQEMITSPLQFFSQMRRQGGYGRPLSFAVCASIVGVGLWLASWLVLTIISMVLQHKLPVEEMARADPRALGQKQGQLCFDFCSSGLLIALAITVHTIGSTALIHATLLMFGAANHRFQTTFRIVAYAIGGTMLVSAVPFIGFYVAVPIQPIYIGIGLKQAQGVDAGIAVIVILLPLFLCGVGLGLLLMIAGFG